ncbi:MAG: hypothetical protein ACPGNV_10580 [Mangrovicoccus sp.]
MQLRSAQILFATSFALVTGLAGAAWACPVCTLKPDLSLADKVLINPLTGVTDGGAKDLLAMDMINGLAADLAMVPGIAPELLQDYDQAPVVITYGEDRDSVSDDPYAPPIMAWEPLMPATPRRVAVLREIVASGRDWTWGADPEDAFRFEFFAALHADPDPVLRDMAWGELQRGAYHLIRTVTPGLSQEELRAVLDDPARPEFHALAILLLGLAAEPEGWLAEQAQRQISKADPENLGAWIAALSEADGESAIAAVEARILSGGGDLPLETRTAAIVALSMIGDARPELRGVLAQKLANFARSTPEFGADVAYALYLWDDWRLAKEAQAWIDDEIVTDHAQIYMLQIYADTAFHQMSGQGG